VVASIDTGESLALLDRTGRWAVWSVVEEQTVPSSAVSRVARLFVLDRWTGETRTLAGCASPPWHGQAMDHDFYSSAAYLTEVVRECGV
jgi:hypothetical protein